MQLFSADASIFLKKNAPENMKKTLSKVAHNQSPIFFSLLPTGPKPTQISDIFDRNLPPREFAIMTLLAADWLLQFTTTNESTK